MTSTQEWTPAPPSRRERPAGRRRRGLSGRERVAAALLGLLLLAAAAWAAVAAAPRALGCASLVVQSGSMGSAEPVGGLVLACGRPTESVRVGDVVLVRRAGSAGQHVNVLHRVAALEERQGARFVRLKGDANPTPDPNEDRLTGPVLSPVLTVPRVGYAVAWLQSPTSLLLVLMTIGAVLVFARSEPRRGD